MTAEAAPDLLQARLASAMTQISRLQGDALLLRKEAAACLYALTTWVACLHRANVVDVSEYQAWLQLEDREPGERSETLRRLTDLALAFSVVPELPDSPTPSAAESVTLRL